MMDDDVCRFHDSLLKYLAQIIFPLTSLILKIPVNFPEIKRFTLSISSAIFIFAFSPFRDFVIAF